VRSESNQLDQLRTKLGWVARLNDRNRRKD
jgi:hypothetical protein